MGEKRGMKALELWCKRVTDGYPGVKVENMTTSWRDGLAFCALIHHFRPDLIDFSSLKKNNIFVNNELAFRTAERHLGIPALLDAEDMVEYEVPDRLSILTYLSQFYQTFASHPSSPIKRSPDSPQFSDSSLGLSTSGSTPPPKEVRRRDPCVVCGNPVFLAQRLLVSGRLYHRTCFRCARCHSQLTTANFYETENGEFCCETCPDEEMDQEIGDKGGGLPPSPLLPKPQPPHDDDKTDSLASTRSASLVGLRRMMFENITQATTDDDKEIPRKLSLREGDNLSRKMSGDKESVSQKLSLSDKVIDSPRQLLVNDKPRPSEPDVMEDDYEVLSSKSSHRLSFKVRKSENESISVESSLETQKPVSLPSDCFIPKMSLSQDNNSATYVEEFSSLNTTTDSGIVETENLSVNAQIKLDLDSDLEPISDSSDVSTVQAKNIVCNFNEEVEKDKLVESKESIEKKPIEAKNNVVVSDSLKEENMSLYSENEVLIRRAENESLKQSGCDFLKEEDEFTSLTQNIEKLVLDAKNEETIDAVEKEQSSSQEVCEGKDRPENNKFTQEVSEIPMPVERIMHKPPTPRNRKVKKALFEPKVEVKKPVEEYPEELNPFGDDEEEVIEKQKSSSSLNPFGSSDEEEEELKDVKKETETPKPAVRKVIPAPKVNLNPFGSDDDEEEVDVTLPPEPKPRKLMTPQPSPEPSPRIRRLRPATGSLGSSTSIASRKKKPAPLPPNWQPSNTPGSRKSYAAPRPPTTPSPPPLPLTSPPSSRPSSPLWETECKQLFNRQRQNSITSETSSIGTASTFSSYTPHKSMSGQWRRKKGPAPARPVPVRRNVAPMPLVAVRQELHDIEVKQQGLERQGVKLEQTIRDKFEQEGASLTPYVEEMVLQLFELVNEKNELFRRQAELMYLRRQHNLEEEHAELEYQIRCLMMRPERNKTDSDKAKEEQLIQRLVEVVERRNEIIDCLEMDRLREKEEDRSVGTQLGIFSAAVGSEVDLRTLKPDKKKKDGKRRWSKKEKVLEKETEDIGEKKKSKKKWFTLHHLTRS
ncbi:MICAL-like protein 1 isoform X2 [Macrosteles quadrilineatus]|nr:MICAL-like protein 1 isoform X2 [Macrosteles quadrilineatus]